MASRFSVIQWKKQDEKELKKAVTKFNKKVARLEKLKGSKDYLPEEVDFEGTKDLIQNRQELKRVINMLDRFTRKGAEKKVTLKSGEEITAWQKNEIAIQKGLATRRIKRQMKEEEKPYFKMRFGKISQIRSAVKFN